MEEVFAMKNYLDPERNPQFKDYLEKNGIQKKASFNSGRTYGISKILELHGKKGYRLETVFAAQNIFDRYLSMIGHWDLTE